VMHASHAIMMNREAVIEVKQLNGVKALFHQHTTS
jgi:hypothetical protein